MSAHDFYPECFKAPSDVADVTDNMALVRQRFGHPPPEKTKMKRRATAKQLKALAKGQAKMGHAGAARKLRARAAAMGGGKSKARRSTSRRRNNPVAAAAVAKVNRDARRLEADAHKAALAVARPKRTKTVKHGKRKAAKRLYTTRARPSHTTARRSRRDPKGGKSQMITWNARRRRNGTFRNNPLQAFLDNPVSSAMFKPNSRRRRRSSSKRTVHHKRRVYRNNPIHSGGSMVDMALKMAEGVITFAVFYTLADVFDRYMATRAQGNSTAIATQGHLTGADAAAAILAKPTMSRMLIQLGAGTVLAIGAYYGAKKNATLGVIAAGAAGGVLGHWAVQSIRSYIMPAVLPAGDGTSADTSLGWRLFPIEQANPQIAIQNALTMDTNTGGTPNTATAPLFPFLANNATVTPVGVAGAPPPRAIGSGAAARALPPPAPQVYGGGNYAGQGQPAAHAHTHQTAPAAAPATAQAGVGCPGGCGGSVLLQPWGAPAPCTSCASKQIAGSADGNGWAYTSDGKWLTPSNDVYTGAALPWMANLQQLAIADQAAKAAGTSTGPQVQVGAAGAPTPFFKPAGGRLTGRAHTN